VEYEYVSRHKVYERDGWVCGICGDAIDRSLGWPDLMCASLDHVIPMVDGGPHLYSNVQAAHFLCNSYKAASNESFRVA
jgi:5-methylcytosine-specific restriction endonuclease McrA